MYNNKLQIQCQLPCTIAQSVFQLFGYVVKIRLVRLYCPVGCNLRDKDRTVVYTVTVTVFTTRSVHALQSGPYLS